MIAFLISAAILGGLPGTSAAPGLDPTKSIGQFVLDTWSTDDGLPVTNVNAVLQSTNGYLWIGTDEGLVRFNGSEFRTFDRDPAFSSNNVYALSEDADGVVWIGTAEGIVLYENGTMQPFNHLPQSAAVEALGPGRGGVMWVGTWDDGLLRCEREGCQELTTKEDTPTGKIQVISRGDGVVWVGADTGLFRIGPESLDLVSGGFPVQALSYSADLGLIVSSQEAGVAVLEGDVLRTLPPSDGWPQDKAWTIQTDRNGSIWFGLTGAAIARRSSLGYEEFDLNNGTGVHALIEDQEGSLWIGTQGAGLARLREGAFTTIDAAQGLSESYVTSISETSDSLIMAGTFGGGIDLLDPKTLKVRDHLQGVPSDNITGVVGAQDGTVWVATIDAGVTRFVEGRPSSIEGLPSESIYALHAGESGAMWIGTDRGLAHVTSEGVTVITEDDGLGSNSIVDIAHDGTGTVWVGTYGAGLTRLDTDGSSRVFDESDGLGSNIVASLLYSTDGTLWIGTVEGGLSTLRGDALITYSIADGLFDHTIFQIIEDDLGYLWMGSNKGVARVSKAAIARFSRGEIPQIPVQSFGTDDGLRSAEINGGAQPAGWKSRDGRIWLPTVAGAAVADPSNLNPNRVPPPVLVERVTSDGEPVAHMGTVILVPGTRRIDFEFAALSLIDPEAIRYRYRLEGVEEAWSPPSPVNTASYTYLKPGTYKFHVIAANNDGLWNEDGAYVNFVLEPYFYQTQWFWMLLASGVFLLGTAFFRSRTRHLKEQRLQLEEMVEARTRDVMAAKDQIQAQSDALRSSLREKDILLREVHHRVKNNLQMISSLLQLQAREVSDDETKAKFRECRDRIYSFAMVHERLYMARDMSKFDFKDYLSGLTEQLIKSSTLAGADISLELDLQSSNMDVDRAISCGLIVTEFVTNALRHAFEEGSVGYIRVSFERAGRFAVLSVDDNGIGFQRHENDSAPGLGLKLVKALVMRLKGDLSVARRLEGGTSCEVRFPFDIHSIPDPAIAEVEMA